MADIREAITGPGSSQVPTEYPEGSFYYLAGAAILGVINLADSIRLRVDEIVDSAIVTKSQQLESGHSRYQDFTSNVDATVVTGVHGERTIVVRRDTPSLDVYRETKVEVTPAEYGLKPFISAERVVTDGLFDYISSKYNQTRNPRHRNTLSPIGVLRSVIHAKRAQKAQARQENRNMKEAANALRHIFGTEGSPLK